MYSLSSDTKEDDRMSTITCTKCNASFPAIPGREFMFCTNCGEKIIIPKAEEPASAAPVAPVAPAASEAPAAPEAPVAPANAFGDYSQATDFPTSPASTFEPAPKAPEAPAVAPAPAAPVAPVAAPTPAAPVAPVAPAPAAPVTPVVPVAPVMAAPVAAFASGANMGNGVFDMYVAAAEAEIAGDKLGALATYKRILEIAPGCEAAVRGKARVDRPVVTDANCFLSFITTNPQYVLRIVVDDAKTFQFMSGQKFKFLLPVGQHTFKFYIGSKCFARVVDIKDNTVRAFISYVYDGRNNLDITYK